MLQFQLQLQVLHRESTGHLLLQHAGSAPARAPLVDCLRRRRLGDGQRVPGGADDSHLAYW